MDWHGNLCPVPFRGEVVRIRLNGSLIRIGADQNGMGSTKNGDTMRTLRLRVFFRLLLPIILFLPTRFCTGATSDPGGKTQDKTAMFRVELYHQDSADSSRSNAVVSEVTLAEGATLYLEDKHTDHPNVLHYNFRVLKVASDVVIMEQIPDRFGKMRPFDTGEASPNRQLRLESGKPYRISSNLSDEGPVWTVTRIIPHTQPTRIRPTSDHEDYRNFRRFFEMFLENPSFSVGDAVELLGEKQDESLPDRIILRPRSPDVSSVQLELDSGNFLAGISIQFAVDQYPAVLFSELIREHGEPQQLPLPPPNIPPGGYYRADHSYRFQGRGVLEGSLIVTVEGERKEDLNQAVKVLYRRWRT
jgi:hypothetical protein